MRRRTLLGGFGAFGAAAAYAELVTHDTVQEAEERADKITNGRLLAALNEKTGGQWAIQPRGAYRITQDGRNIHQENIYVHDNQSVGYSLTTVSEKKSVEFFAEKDSDGQQVLPDASALEPQDKKIIVALIKAPTNIFTTIDLKRPIGYSDAAINKVISGATGVDTVARFYEGRGVVFETRPKDGSIGTVYQYNYSRNLWSLRSVEIEDRRHVWPNGEIAVGRDRDGQTDSLRLVPAVTGEGVTLSDHARELAQIVRGIQPEPVVRSSGFRRMLGLG